MDIIELTRKLGAAIQREEAYKNFMAVRDKNDKDEELQKQIGEFNLLKMQLDEELAKEERNDSKVREANERVLEVYNTIMAGEAMQEYNKAYADYKALTDKIMNILAMCQNGEDPETCEPSNCTGNCSSCSGCH